MFIFEHDEEYHMPAFFGPRPGAVASRRYNKITKIVVCYLTEADEYRKNKRYIHLKLKVPNCHSHPSFN